MNYRQAGRRLYAYVCGLLAIGLSSCSMGSTLSSTGAGAYPPPSAAAGLSTLTLEQALTQLDALPAPADANPQTYEQLKGATRATLLGSGKQRWTAAAPSGQGSQVDDLRIYTGEAGAAQAIWSYRNQGDYDQNSEANIADLTPIATYFSRTSAWHFWSRATVVDGDANGEINIADLTPLGQHLLAKVDAYAVESAATADAEQWESFGTAEFATSEVPADGGVRRFSFTVTAPVTGSFYRVVPMQGSERGIPSVPFAYAGESAPDYILSGTVRDSAAAPLAGVTLSLDSQSDVLSAADGSYSFNALHEGLNATLTPRAEGLTFIPLQRSVYVGAGDISGQEFTGFAMERIDTTLPAEAGCGEELQFELRAVDSAGTTLTGFNTEGRLIVPEGVRVLQHPLFVDGVAQAAIRCEAAGDYALQLRGVSLPDDLPLGQVLATAPVAPAVELTKWQGGADAAISLSFDDGTLDQWSRGLPMWEEYGFHVTLGIASSRFENDPTRVPDLQVAFDAGHEIANHTQTHADLTTLTAEQARLEITNCEDFLKANVTGLEQIFTVVYPYEMFNDTVTGILQDLGYLCARSGQQGNSEYAELNDPYNPPLLHLYSWANLNLLELWMWDSTTDWAVDHGGWLVEQCHGIGAQGEAGVGWSPRPESDYRAHYDHIKSFGDRLWVAPMGEVARFIVERNTAQLTVSSFTASTVNLELTNTLDGAYYTIPLTISMVRPEGWSSAVAEQNGVALPVRASGDGLSLLFNAVPDGGPIVVSSAAMR